MDLFLSTFESKIDKKGRASIPARYRSLLERNNEELILFTTPETQYIQGCGNNYINRLWQTNLELDQVSDEALYIQDILSDSTHVKIDAEGRVLLSENFINVADLEQTILFAGRGETFQIWNPDKYIKTSTCGKVIGGFVSNESLDKSDKISLFNSTMSYTLYTVTNGNFKPKPSNKNEAF